MLDFAFKFTEANIQSIVLTIGTLGVNSIRHKNNSHFNCNLVMLLYTHLGKRKIPTDLKVLLNEHNLYNAVIQKQLIFACNSLLIHNIA